MLGCDEIPFLFMWVLYLGSMFIVMHGHGEKI